MRHLSTTVVMVCGNNGGVVLQIVSEDVLNKKATFMDRDGNGGNGSWRKVAGMDSICSHDHG